MKTTKQITKQTQRTWSYESIVMLTLGTLISIMLSMYAIA